MTHLEWINKTKPPLPCAAAYITFGGKCLNCGWNPDVDREYEIKAEIEEAKRDYER